MLDWQAGGKCSRHCEAIILRVGDMFNIRSDKLGHTAVIRSDTAMSAEGLCCLLTKVLKHDLTLQVYSL